MLPIFYDSTVIQCRMFNWCFVACFLLHYTINFTVSWKILTKRVKTIFQDIFRFCILCIPVNSPVFSKDSPVCYPSLPLSSGLNIFTEISCISYLSYKRVIRTNYLITIIVRQGSLPYLYCLFSCDTSQNLTSNYRPPHFGNKTCSRILTSSHPQW